MGVLHHSFVPPVLRWPATDKKLMIYVGLLPLVVIELLRNNSVMFVTVNRYVTRIGRGRTQPHYDHQQSRGAHLVVETAQRDTRHHFIEHCSS